MHIRHLAAAQARKERLINDMVSARADLLAAAEALPAAAQGVPYLGAWTVSEMLAHLAGWDVTNRQAAAQIMDEQLPVFYTHAGKDWSSFNALLVAQYGGGTLPELVAQARRTHADLISFIETLTPLKIERDHGLRYRGYRVTIARLLQAETADEREHHRQLAAFAASFPPAAD